MESIKTVTDRVVNTLESKPKCQMVKQECSICYTVLEFEWDGRDRYDLYNPKPTICSQECYDKDTEIKDKKHYDQNIGKIPLKYRDIECDNSILKDCYSLNLFITGKSGTGKTVLAAGIAKECIKNKKDFKWISYSDFIMELQGMFKKEGESPFDKAQEISNYEGVLIIDDLGAEKATDFVRQITYNIVNEREQRMLPLVVTSNFTLEEIAAQIDSRIAGMCKTIKLTGKDRRIDEKDKQWKTGNPKYIAPKMRRP
jgi:DNA replication protein DnaC